MEIENTRIKEKLAEIMAKSWSKAEHAKQTKRIPEGELCELVETIRDNVNDIGVLDRVMDCDST